MIETRKLSNGATVLFERVATTSTVSVGFWYPYGSRDEKKGQYGFSHFIEHMLFKGTGKRTAYQIAQEIDRVGGIINAFTEKEVTCFYCITPKNSIKTAIDVLSDMIVNSKLDEKEIGRELPVVLNEIHSIEDSPDEKAHEIYLKLMWDNHPLANRITGEEENVRAITYDSLISYYRKRYHPVNLIISIAGNINIDEVYNYLENIFGKLKSEKFLAERKKPVERVFADQIKSKFAQVHIYSGTVYTASPLLEEYYDMVVFSTLMGESISSRLFQVLREEKGLCYSVYSFRTYFSDIAQWTVYASTTPSDLDKLLTSLRVEIEKVRKSKPGNQEIEDAKTHLLGGITIAKEDMETRMKRLARQYILRGRIFNFRESVDQINRVDKKRIDRLINKVILERNFNILVYGKGKTGFKSNEMYFI